MTMGVVYQWTFFLALGLLAIVITVFVFAVSLLGRALEAAVKSENEKLAERKENNAKEMASIKKEIEKAEAKGEIPKGLTRRLEQLEKKDKKFGRELAKIRRAPKLLTVKGGIIPPGVSLLVALILSGVAWYFWYLSTTQIFIWMVWIEPVFIWIVSLVAILYSIFRIYKSLRAVERVAITSEEAALKKTVEAFKMAQKELEEEKKLKLEMRFEDARPPFTVKAKSEMLIKINVGVTKGDVARNAVVAFWAPSVFKFPDSPESLPSGNYPSCVSTSISLGDIIRPAWRTRRIKLKVPSQPSSYTMAYRLFCEGFDSDYQEFEVIVK
jgi:uncharacterized membrane protein